jgi:tRNA pseudouridine38-40 synthase
MRIKFIVAYDGTDFRGWARSPGHRTVHDVLSAAIHRVCGHEVELVGASRTDSGAHARGQVCHFDTDVPIETSKWPTVLNRVLPPDIALFAARPVSNDFHARFCAEDRLYRYRIRQTGRDPFAGRYAHEYGGNLDVTRMQSATKLLVGTHDYRAFTEDLDPSVENTTRTLRQVEVYEPPPESYTIPGKEVWIDVVGTAFLRGMMRRISGGLLEVGRGQRSLEEFGSLLTPEWTGMHLPVVLPAKGLCLMRVRYGDPPRDCRNQAATELGD